MVLNYFVEGRTAYTTSCNNPKCISRRCGRPQAVGSTSTTSKWVRMSRKRPLNSTFLCSRVFSYSQITRSVASGSGTPYCTSISCRPCYSALYKEALAVESTRLRPAFEIQATSPARQHILVQHVVTPSSGTMASDDAITTMRASDDLELLNSPPVDVSAIGPCSDP